MADFQASDYRIFETSNLCALIFFTRVTVSPNRKKRERELNSRMSMKIPVGNYQRLPDDPLTYILTVQRYEDGNRLLLRAIYTGQRTVRTSQAKTV